MFGDVFGFNETERVSNRIKITIAMKAIDFIVEEVFTEEQKKRFAVVLEEAGKEFENDEQCIRLKEKAKKNEELFGIFNN